MSFMAHHCTSPRDTLESHWKSFNRQLDKICQLLQFLSQQPSALTHSLAMLQVELTNMSDI